MALCVPYRAQPSNIGRRITFFLRLMVSTRMPPRYSSSETQGTRKKRGPRYTSSLTCWESSLTGLKSFLNIKLADSGKIEMKDNSPLDIAARAVGEMTEKLLFEAAVFVRKINASRLTSSSIAVAFGAMFPNSYMYNVKSDKQLEKLKEAAKEYMTFKESDDKSPVWSFKRKDDKPVWSKSPATWIIKQYKYQKEADASLTLAMCALLYAVDILKGGAEVAKANGRKGAVQSEIQKVVEGIRRDRGSAYPERIHSTCIDTKWVIEMKRPKYEKDPELYKRLLDKYVKREKCGVQALQALASRFSLTLPKEYMPEKPPSRQNNSRYNLRT